MPYGQKGYGKMINSHKCPTGKIYGLIACGYIVINIFFLPVGH